MYVFISLKIVLTPTNCAYPDQRPRFVLFPLGLQCLHKLPLRKVSKGAKIRNRYNQVPHLTQDTNGKVTKRSLVYKWLMVEVYIQFRKQSLIIQFHNSLISLQAQYLLWYICETFKSKYPFITLAFICKINSSK